MKKQSIIAVTAAALAISLAVVGNAAATDNEQQTEKQAAIAMQSYTDEDGITYVGSDKDNMLAIYCECGTCGAHVTDWYYVLNYDKDKTVPICNYCYEIALEEDKTSER